MCDGKGYIYVGTAPNPITRYGYKRICDKCHGTGEIEQTNDEWRRTCSTEDFAEFINLIIRVGPYENEPKDFWEHVYGRGGEHGAKSIVEWLKQPHREE